MKHSAAPPMWVTWSGGERAQRLYQAAPELLHALRVVLDRVPPPYDATVTAAWALIQRIEGDQ